MKLIGALKAAKRTAPFYSAVDEALAAIKRPKGTGAEFYTELTKQAGVKKAELADRKLEQAFKAKGKMTKEEAQQVLADNPPPQLKEKVYDEASAIDENVLREMVSQEMFGKPYSQIDFGSAQHRKISDEVYKRMDADIGTTYGNYRTPDGENYREILLKLPESFTKNDFTRLLTLEAEQRRGELTTAQLKELVDLQAKKQTGPSNYVTGHWKEDPNVLAHMRVQDRKGANGEKILHVEEIQSDWHQAGRAKGYTDPANRFEVFDPKDGTPIAKFATIDEAKEFASKAGSQYDYGKSEGVPDAPFKKNWHELAMKRLLNYAADNGYDSIAITPGAEQANRYKLSSHIDNMMVSETNQGTRQISWRPKGERVDSALQFDEHGNVVQSMLADLKGKNISNIFGKDMSEKIMQAKPYERFEGVDLDVGGEGMMGFYDKMLPDYLNNFGKPYGARVGIYDIDIPKMINVGSGAQTEVGRQQIPLHNFPITPEMRESIKQKGLPLYQQVGIPTAGAGAASQMLEPEEEAGLATGGVVKSAVKQAQLAKLAKMRQEMAPRAEAVKSLIARDQNRYLADVAPNSLTNAEIQAEIARMAARAKASGQQEGVLPRAERDANLSKSFKDSKVNQTVYHGTMRGDIEEFKTPAYFGSKPVANQFSDPEYMYGSSKLNEGENPTVYPVRLNLKNPKVFTDFDDYEAHVMDNGLDVQRWKKQGHDGVVYAPDGNINDPDAYFVAFEPTQIKSAIGNRGTYDVSKPDIKKAKGGRVRMTTNRDTMFMELSNKKLKRK